MKRVLIASLLASLGCGCASMIPAQPRSARHSGERVEVEIEHKTQARGLPLLAAAAIPAACNLAVRHLSSALKSEVSAYTADYTGAVADDLFYVPGARGLNDAQEAPEINVKKITIERYIRNAKGEEELAFLFELAMRPSFDQTEFQLQPLRAQMNYAKAKVAARSWLRPWTYAIRQGDTVDVNVIIDIQGYWIDPQGVSHAERVASVNIPLRRLRLGEERTSFGNTESQWFPAVPVSVVKDVDGSLLHGTGNYVLSAHVVEVDDAGKRVAFFSQQLEENREVWIDRLLKDLK